MKRLHSLWLLVALSLLFALPALAGDKGGVTLPDQITVVGKSLVLNGMGVREATILKIDVYVAGLYLESKSQDAQAIIASKSPKRLVIRFVRDVDQEDIQKAWKDGFRKNSSATLPALSDRINTLNGWMTSMSAGETLSFTYIPSRGIEVNVNGSVKGFVPGDDFASALFSIWLGANPPNAGLKNGLLGR